MSPVFSAWFWVFVLSGFAIAGLTHLIHQQRNRRRRLTFRVAQQSSAIKAHRRGFRIGNLVVQCARAVSIARPR